MKLGHVRDEVLEQYDREGEKMQAGQWLWRILESWAHYERRGHNDARCA
jgi:hypothetical protein